MFNNKTRSNFLEVIWDVLLFIAQTVMFSVLAES